MARNECRCSFCGKAESRVMKLLKGPNDVYICDECVALCQDIIDDELQEEESEFSEEDINLLNVMMKNGNTLEIQGTLDFNLIVFAREELENIVAVEESPLELDSLLSMPGLTGIRIKAGDSLWSVAKENHTTREAIRQNNPGLEEPLRKGAVLLLLKQIE